MRHLHATQSTLQPQNDSADHAAHFAQRPAIASMSIADDNLLFDRLQRKLDATGTFAGDHLIAGVTTGYDKENIDHGHRNVACCERAAGALIGNCCELCAPTCFDKTIQVSAIDSTRTKHAIEPDALAKRWNIGIEKAKNTLQVTTQKGIRTAVHPVQRRFKTAQPHLRKRRLEGPFYSDTAKFRTKSVHGDVYAQITTDGKGFADFWPMKRKLECNDGLVHFINSFGVPEWMVTDGAPEEGGGSNTAWRDTERIYHMRHTFTEPYSPWQNRAEGKMREIKRGIKRFLKEAKAPKRL
jgi:hypothetical protein